MTLLSLVKVKFYKRKLQVMSQSKAIAASQNIVFLLSFSLKKRLLNVIRFTMQCLNLRAFRKDDNYIWTIEER